MAQLTPLISTTQEGALFELLEQMKDSQAARILVAGSSLFKIIDSHQVSYRTAEGMDILTFSGSLQIESNPDGQGRSIQSAKIVWV